MQTSRRTKASSVDAAIQNPFDSSDDESAASRSSSRSYVRSSGIAPFPNPFDDVVAHPKKGNHHSAASTNPFDDDEHPHTKTTTARRSSSSNPFDDEEQPKHAVLTSNPRRKSSPTQGRRALSEEKSKDHVSSSNRHSGSINPFDDDEDAPSKPTSGGQRLSRRAGAQSSYENEGNAAVNLAANSTSSNIEGFQSTQSKSEESYKYPEMTVKSERSSASYHTSVKEKMSSISDGVAHRAQKLKQGTIGQFKAGNGSADNLNDPEKPKKSGYGDSNPRDLLFEGGYADHGKKLPQGASRYVSYEQTHTSSTGFEGQSVQELESYAVHKSEETTSTIYNCLRIAEDTKEVAVKTTLQLHEQGEQIRRTHETAVEVDLELSRGEKLLGSLGGLFSKTWKPKKTRNISGPVTRGDSFKRKAFGLEQRAALGLTPGNARGKVRHSAIADGSHSQAQTLLEVEKSKQDDALSDLSNVLGHLKEMTIDMGKEIERQNGDLDHLHDDVTELGYRVKGANERGRRLLHR